MKGGVTIIPAAPGYFAVLPLAVDDDLETVVEVAIVAWGIVCDTDAEGRVGPGFAAPITAVDTSVMEDLPGPFIREPSGRYVSPYDGEAFATAEKCLEKIRAIYAASKGDVTFEVASEEDRKYMDAKRKAAKNRKKKRRRFMRLVPRRPRK